MSSSPESPAQDVDMGSGSEAETETDAESLFIAVCNTLAGRAKEVNFAIGGKIEPKALNGVTIRWDSGPQNQGRKLTLPVNDDAVAQNAFDQLVKDAEPATFGFGSQEVLDESYRKAGKIDEDKFCTNFNPYEHGIMDAVTQALVQSGDAHPGLRGIRAELYKLNLYSGPSGKFKAHVDTPRSEDQMGSLVVCLPYPHKGGQLAVRHQGREVIFDWASKSPDSIQWASFFSDCEHEVLEVTEGHRVTLTYNLFWAAYGPAAQGGRLNALDLKSTVFFSALQKLLDCPGFHPKGGLLGFTCTHAYPHSSQLTLHKLHHTLKGIDMLVYQALMRLVGNARVSAVLDDSEYQDRIRDGGWDYDDSDGSQSDKGVVAHCTTRPPLTDWTGPPVTWADYEEGEPLDPESIDHSVRAHDRAPWKRELLYPRREVTWLNFAPTSQTPQELAVTFLTYGNQPELDTYYSSAVIIAELQGME